MLGKTAGLSLPLHFAPDALQLELKGRQRSAQLVRGHGEEFLAKLHGLLGGRERLPVPPRDGAELPARHQAEEEAEQQQQDHAPPDDAGGAHLLPAGALVAKLFLDLHEVVEPRAQRLHPPLASARLQELQERRLVARRLQAQRLRRE